MRKLMILGVAASDITGSIVPKEIFQNRELRFLLALILIGYLIIMGGLFWYDKRKKRLWVNSYIKKEKLNDRINSAIYHTLRAFPITRDYIEKLSYQFRLISPCDSKQITKKTVGICLITSIISVFTFLFIFSMNPKLITLITSAVAIIICNIEIVGRNARDFEIKLNQEMQLLIENEIHNYYVNYRVDDAIYQSMDSLSPNMRIAAEQIYQLLLSDDREQALAEYYENVPNKFLREFVSLCVGVAERGDEQIHGKPMFVRNMENLYTQLEIEIEKLQRLKLEFTGVALIVIIPIFCIDLVKWFCISLKENMNVFYYGKSGFLIDIGLMIITSIIYIVMHKSADYVTFHQSTHRWLYTLDKVPIIKKSMDNYCDKYASKLEGLRKKLRNNGYNIKPRHFILRSFLLAFTVFLLAFCINGYLNYDRKQSLLKVKVSEVAVLTSAANEKQYDKMSRIIEEKVHYYVGDKVAEEKNDYSKTEQSLSEQLKHENSFSNNLINEAMAKEILRRVQMYHASDMSCYDFLGCLMLGVVAYFIPFILLRYSSSVSRDAMEDEVNQFYALIGILMYDRSMTVKRILLELESYAVVFKSSLINCINDYGAGDIEALNNLKENEPYSPFARIVDNLIRCDTMPVYEAFHENDVEREGYLAKRKLSNEKSIRKRVVRAYVLAAVPFLLLFAYGMIPTLLAAVNEITETMEALSGAV